MFARNPVKFLFVTDLDNTLVGDDAALAFLNDRLSSYRQEYGTKIVYSTGRSLVSYKHLRSKKHLLDPDALVTAVGTEVYLNPQDETPDSQWSQQLSPGWNRELVLETAGKFADLLAQPDSEQRPFKVSYFLSETVAPEVLPRLEDKLKEQDLNFKLVYSGGKDLDILPEKGDKGLAMQFLRQKWQIPPEKTVVCGDSGNDIALFSVGTERGIIVGNALPELRQWHEANETDYRYLAQKACAAGIWEGLQYFGFIQ
ncbi:sucrose-phosphate phosphatase [Desertifilum sp. FACHB-1129]|uniref:sucrose-phosphate phosphatase n=1 Tax=Desertifilum tharense IPPAS B-1220 TaxID=1781255 RepID=A0A1E5QJV0_9CYAN|nr:MULTISPECIES: sucrose-phosphate phosphatase [unclassified Desertifilum]MBD2313423.1 sucrose-phosphate phosphatase [Desertifilum sp. FACHB-1129]MBD2322293.1 sucrose-phosphate phosphatase [Desertifilum sp. FACHB-866]MBD2332455.1 sucrose-phosphate phosphatase [Desertifilum sp. FACHB-868]OEJ74864.1 sucrose-phosphate phosphatase [Desertifilum tharense IPPAS B-1220]